MVKYIETGVVGRSVLKYLKKHIPDVIKKSRGMDVFICEYEDVYGLDPDEYEVISKLRVLINFKDGRWSKQIIIDPDYLDSETNEMVCGFETAPILYSTHIKTGKDYVLNYLVGAYSKVLHEKINYVRKVNNDYYA